MLTSKMKLFMAFVLIYEISSVEFHISNNTPDVLWIGIYCNASKVLEDGGFVLRPLGQRVVKSPEDWNGIIWARTLCDAGSKTCQTGSCGRKIQCAGSPPTPPVTLIEIKLKHKAGQDIYGVSLIDGFNIEAEIVPLNGAGKCKPSRCLKNLNANCHRELSIFGNAGEVVGCQSSCNRYDGDCCWNQFERCKQNWPIDSTDYFKFNCPEVLAYTIYDGNNFTCLSDLYAITFSRSDNYFYP